MSDTIWNELQAEARELIAREPLLASYVYACVLNHNSLSSSLSYLLAHKLANYVMSAVAIRELFDRAFADNPQIVDSAAVDIKAVYERGSGRAHV